MKVYYNEIDGYCCDWLQNLIDAGQIPPGKIDDRDIRLVRPDDLSAYDQCHFFAGIGGWAYALSLSGYDGPVWTGSCPCQPFSAAGKGQASGDERHLWPIWFELIKAVRPPIIFGEQVEAAIGWGWLDLVHSDMEQEGYSIRSAVLPAASVGAPHIRQRLWFVADARACRGRRISGEQSRRGNVPTDSSKGELADADGSEQGAGRGNPTEVRRLSEAERQSEHGPALLGGSGEYGELADAGNGRHGSKRDSAAGRGEPISDCLMGNSGREGLEGQRGFYSRPEQGEQPISAAAPGRTNPWSNLIWLPCTDGKQRPTGVEYSAGDGRIAWGAEPSWWGAPSGCGSNGQGPTKSIIQPLAHGVPARVGKLRAAGNAIVPQVAASFIKAAMTDAE